MVEQPRLDGLEAEGGGGAGLTAFLLGLDVVEEEVAHMLGLHRGESLGVDPHESTGGGERVEPYLGGHSETLREVLVPVVEVRVHPAMGASRGEARSRPCRGHRLSVV